MTNFIVVPFLQRWEDMRIEGITGTRPFRGPGESVGCFVVFKSPEAARKEFPDLPDEAMCEVAIPEQEKTNALERREVQGD